MYTFSNLINIFKLLTCNKKLANKLTLILLVASLVSVVVTYIELSNSNSPLGPSPSDVIGLILIDLILLLLLSILIFRKIFRFWSARKKNIDGTRLQGRILLMFSIVACLPTMIMAIFSAIFFNYGIQSWFDDRITTALHNSVAVANSYFLEHTENIRSDAIGMANDIDANYYNFVGNDTLFNNYINGQARARSLTEAVVFHANQVVAHTALSFSYAFDRLPSNAIEKAKRGEVVIIERPNEDENKVRALIKLNNFYDTYLLISRFLDQTVVNHITEAKAAADQFSQLKQQISSLQIKFSLVYIVIALLLLFLAIASGILFASWIIGPINQLIYATSRIKLGDFSTRIFEGPENDEIGILTRAFNSMTAQIQAQREALLEATTEIDNKRKFSEAVLAGVSSGVIAVDKNLRIRLANKHAKKLLFSKNKSFISSKILKLVPEFALAFDNLNYEKEHEIEIHRDNKKYVLLVKIVSENEYQNYGYIITFDDISQLIVAQRTAAWSDVARRIAHEIKNPLTPIQLASDRLRKNFAEKSLDTDLFNKYMDTIQKHVLDIGKMVEEFVNFARMQAPSFAKENIIDVVKNAIFFQHFSGSSAKFIQNINADNITLNIDSRQINQVLLNIFKNSIEANEKKSDLIIKVSIIDNESFVELIIEDNGNGFPKDLINRLIEPYVTTKTKGSGLGLAIVKKILDDHSAKLVLENSMLGGALVKIVFYKMA